MKGAFPVGPYHFVNVMKQFTGQPLSHGIYRIIIERSPVNLRYPFFGIKRDGLYNFD
jgi:hypothetical protein